MSASFFQGGNDYCDQTRSTDNMIKTFIKDREKILTLLKREPEKLVNILWKNNSPICKDDDCLFQMGKSLKLTVDDLLEKNNNICDSMIN